MAAENDSGGRAPAVAQSPDDQKSQDAPSASAAAAPSTQKPTYGKIRLDISNSVLPLEKLSSTPSSKDGLSDEVEMQIRSFGCEMIQLAGKLLRLPQVAMATGCVLFQRFYYAKSIVRNPFDVVAMGCIGLASKIEEAPRRIRDIINVFNHIKQVRNGKPILPVVLDMNYISLKNQVIKAERRVLKELGFCVHVKHPHKIIVMYLKWLELDSHRELLQMSWNFMNDSLRTDVFVRYPPETIAVACIYLSARKLKEPLPKNPSWFDVLGVEEDDIKDCCFRMICLYNRKKPNQDELESVVDALRKKMDDERRVKRESAMQSTINTPSQSSPASRSGSPAPTKNPGEAAPGSEALGNALKAASRNNADNDDHRGRSRDREDSHENNGRDLGGFHRDRDREREHHHHHSKKKKKHKQRSRSRSRSPVGDYYYEDHASRHDRKKAKLKRSSRSPSYTPPKKKRHGHKNRHRSRSHERGYDRGYRDQRRGGVASVGLHDESPPPRHRSNGYDRKGRDYRR